MEECMRDDGWREVPEGQRASRAWEEHAGVLQTQWRSNIDALSAPR